MKTNQTTYEQKTIKSHKKVLKLIVEGSDGALWGRVNFNDNLIVDSAPTLKALETQMMHLLTKFHEIDSKIYRFQVEYDLTAFFEEFSFLKVTKIAELSGLNGSLVRQYVTGKKNPSEKQVQKIESAVRKIAEQLSNIHLNA